MSTQMTKTAMTTGANGVPVEVIEASEGAGDVTTVLPPGLVSDEFVSELADEAVAKARNGEFRLTGGDGFLQSLIKAVLERGLAAELSDHLGYDKHDPAGRNGGNSRNGTTPKTMSSELGKVGLEVPRDRAGTFAPLLVPKGSTHIGDGLSDMVISLYAGGMTVRDIEHHLARTLGVEVSHGQISMITDAVLDEVKAWQNRPLDEVYPIMYIDALVVKVKDGAHVRNKAAHLVIGVDVDGQRHVLGIWIQSAEGAKFWMQVFTDLRNRGVTDVLIACCDGLEGLPEAIETIWPRATTQTCVVHLIRAAMKYVPDKARRAVAAALKEVYTAPNEDAALAAFTEFADSDLGKKYPAAVGVWERAWDRFTPFLAFPPPVRKIIYTTNAIEGLNRLIRKIIKNRGHFPNDDAAIKLIWLAIRDIEDKRARAREKEKNKPRNKRTAPGKLVEGSQVQGWKQALNALDAAYPGRLPEHLI